jgi:chemotaxis protein MotB
MIRKRPRTAAVSRNRWLISYADFVTLLLAFFIVLFSSSRADRRQTPHAGATAVQPAPPAPLLEDLTKVLADEIHAGKLDVHPDDRGLVISLRQAAYFPSGGDEIAPDELASLARIAEAIRGIPNALRLEGHADSTPIHNRRFRSNWELSAARSIAMLALFENRFGIPAQRFAVAGYAETKPVDSNDSAEGRAHNRRVDMVILNR